MNYEEKYNAALERAKKLQETCDSTTVVGWCEYIFPELKESEEDKIRQEIIEYIKTGTYHKNWVAWLEKQGEQKTTDKVEPKFHEGDWVVYDHRPYQVVELPKEGYINLGLRRNGKVEFAPSTYCRHWTIEDAVNGDVLATWAGAFIYNGKRDGISCPGSYCGINTLGRFKIGGEKHWTGKKVYPATKEQRDTLFAKMKEAGYKWDSAKKELKKIEPKTLDPDKVVEWLKTNVFDDSAYGKAMIEHFKKDLGL